MSMNNVTAVAAIIDLSRTETRTVHLPSATSETSWELAYQADDSAVESDGSTVYWGADWQIRVGGDQYVYGR
jgi:hypothetical protein